MKISTRTSGIKSRAEYEGKVNECAALEVQLRALNAEMDARLQSVRDEYDDRLSSLANKRDALLSACAQYASMHQEEVLREGLRSGETALAVYGFNLGNPTLVLLNRKHTWKTVVAAVEARGGEWVKKYLTVLAPKPNKDAMKAGLSEGELAELGCRVEQTDAYYIKAKDRTGDERA